MENALSKHSDVRNSLIVLPEAFNNGKRYYDEPRQQPRVCTRSALKQLVAISKKCGVVFIAGMLDPPYNSAYLIDNDDSHLMCHKQEQDDSRNYEPCTANCDISNPVEYEAGAICIGALICADARNNRQRVTCKVEGSSLIYKIICIPAWMSDRNFDSTDLRLPDYQKKYVVLANSNPPPLGSGSFIANTTGKKLGNRNFNEQHNAVVLATWGQLDELDQTRRS